MNIIHNYGKIATKNIMAFLFIYCAKDTCKKVNIIVEPTGDEQVGFFCLGCKNTYLIGRKEEPPTSAPESEK